MNIKKVGLVLACFFIVVIIGVCSLETGYEGKNVVLAEDVRTQGYKEKLINISKDDIELKLEEGEYFNPVFYQDGKLYGSIDNGAHMINKEINSQFPIDNLMKEHLYTLSDNNIKETGKKVFISPDGSTVIGHEKGFNIWDEANGGILKIDYTKEDEPTKLDDLSEKLNSAAGKYNNLNIKETSIDDDNKMMTILNNVSYYGYELYFYNSNNKTLYEMEKQEGRDSLFNISFDVEYIPALKSFVCVDNDLIVYKVVFKDNTYRLEKLIDLSSYLSVKDDTSKLKLIPVSDEEVLLMEWDHINLSENYYNVKTSKISKFNFITNKYEEVFRDNDDICCFATYIGNISRLGGHTFIMEKYNKKGIYIEPVERSIRVLEGNKLKSIYDEDIRDEPHNLSMFMRFAVNEDETEIFIRKDIMDPNNSIETTVGAVYKRYRID